MVVVGVRELRQHTDALLRCVEAGEAIQITDSGKPVAMLAPILSGSAADPLEELRSAGELRQTTAKFADLPEPLEPLPDIPSPSKSIPSPSKTLAVMRSGER